MVGRCHSDEAKRIKYNSTRQRLYERALILYNLEQDKPQDIRDGYRTVCKKVMKEHLMETNGQDPVHISYRTLQNYYRHFTVHSTLPERHFGYLTKDENKVLVSFIQHSAARGWPLSLRRVREHAERILFSRKAIPAEGLGKNWARRFVQRNSDQLSMYYTKPLESARARAVNPHVQKAWFDLLGKTIFDNNITPENIYGTDETGFQTGAAPTERVVGITGTKTQHQHRNGSRETTTVLATICADGTALAPVVIFKGKHFLVRWKQNNPLNASISHSAKGWTNGVIGEAFIKDFDLQTREKAKGAPRLLLVDGHNSHYTQGFIHYARANGIFALCYPAHTTHINQGLDVVVFGLLKRNWASARNNFEYQTHTKVSKDNFLQVLAEAWIPTMTESTIKSAFRITGVSPFNPAIIPTTALLPSLATSATAAIPFVMPDSVQIIASAMQAIARSESSVSSTSSIPSTNHPTSVLSASRPSTSAIIPSLAFADFVPNNINLSALSASIGALPPNGQVIWAELLASVERERILRARFQAQQAVLVLQNVYCEETRQQLKLKEDSDANPKSRERLMGDGMPILLSGDFFTARVDEQVETRRCEKIAQEKRRAAASVYSELLQLWKKEEEARKERNRNVHAANMEAERAWKERKAVALAAKVRFCEPKPLKQTVEKPVPRPEKPTEESSGESIDDDIHSGGDETASDSESDEEEHGEEFDDDND